MVGTSQGFTDLVYEVEECRGCGRSFTFYVGDEPITTSGYIGRCSECGTTNRTKKKWKVNST